MAGFFAVRENIIDFQKLTHSTSLLDDLFASMLHHKRFGRDLQELFWMNCMKIRLLIYALSRKLRTGTDETDPYKTLDRTGRNS